RALAARIEDVRENERTRLSREVHDQLGQSLTGIKIDISFLERRLEQGNTGIEDILDQMKTSVDDLITSVRQIASDLRPGILDDLGIAAAIEWETKRFAERLEISHEFVSEIPHDDFLDPAKATTLFRVFQELLANIARHAEAENIAVLLTPTDGSINLTVTDDGVGFDVDVMNAGESLGLLGIQERVALQGGSVEVYSGFGSGTKTVITIPTTEQLYQQN
ncbi:MAG: sensor histidine kinase, partial [Rhodothermales bacterium]|nr:sensor histidine kinase [Rhodothermales bacterium]